MNAVPANRIDPITVEVIGSRKGARLVREAPMQESNHAVRMLDLLLEFFAAGTHRARGRYHDGRGRRFLMGALVYLRREHRISYARAAYFLKEALPRRQSVLVNSDHRQCGSLAELRAVIVKARAFAVDHAQRARDAAVLERRLLAQVERHLSMMAPTSGDASAAFSPQANRDRLR